MFLCGEEGDSIEGQEKTGPITIEAVFIQIFRPGRYPLVLAKQLLDISEILTGQDIVRGSYATNQVQ